MNNELHYQIDFMAKYFPKGMNKSQRKAYRKLLISLR